MNPFRRRPKTPPVGTVLRVTGTVGFHILTGGFWLPWDGTLVRVTEHRWGRIYVEHTAGEPDVWITWPHPELEVWATPDTWEKQRIAAEETARSVRALQAIDVRRERAAKRAAAGAPGPAIVGELGPEEIAPAGEGT